MITQKSGKTWAPEELMANAGVADTHWYAHNQSMLGDAGGEKPFALPKLW